MLVSLREFFNTILLVPNFWMVVKYILICGEREELNWLIYLEFGVFCSSNSKFTARLISKIEQPSNTSIVSSLLE